MFWRNHRTGLHAVFCALALIAGEASGFAAPAASGLWPWAAAAAVLSLCTIAGWELKGCHMAVFALAGLALAWHAETRRLQLDRHARETAPGGAPPTFTLEVEMPPKKAVARPGGSGWISFRSRMNGIPVKVVARDFPREALPACGEIWSCSGWLSLKKSARHRYAARTLWICNGGSMRRLGESSFAGIRQGYAKAAEKLAQHAATGLKWCPQIAALNQAMLLGMGSALPREKREAFANSGTVHVFAISGLHVMMIAALVNSLLSCLGVPIRARCAIAMPVLAAYVMLTGARPSAVRAALMAAAWMSAGLFGCKADSLSAWSAAAILVYGSSPAAIFDSGCTLSFTVMLGLLLWIKWSAQFSPPSAMLFRPPAAMAPGRAWLVRLRRAIDWLSGMLGVSMAAWIAGAPVVATLFGKISPVGIPANIIMVPLAGVSVVLNAAGTGASLVSPVLGAFFNNLAAFSTMAMDAVSRFAGGIPAGSWDTLPWKWHHFAMWYSAWAACFALLSKKLRPKAPADGYEWSLRP